MTAGDRYASGAAAAILAVAALAFAPDNAEAGPWVLEPGEGYL